MPRPALLRAYALAAAIAAPALAAATLASSRRGGRAGLGERFGRLPEAESPEIWLHAASNGEMASARRLVERLLADHGGMHVLLTAHTVTGRALAAGWALPRTHVALAPWDTPAAARRLLARRRPLAHVVIESELWPNRLLACAAEGVPVMALGARLSARSAARWARAPAAARALLGTLALAAPQDEASAARLLALGLPESALGPVETLKADLAPAPRPADWEALRAAFPRGRTLLAASTHPGEEALALTAFDIARAAIPDLRLIIAPRHPRRLAEIEALLAGRPHAVRSRGEAPGPTIYLADTLGELRALYALAGLAFVGGSVAPMGGHTPYEPAAEGCAIAHGPDVANAAPAYAALAAADAAIEVRDAEGLAAAFAIVADEPRRAALAARARAALAPGEARVPAIVSARVGALIAARA